jgi:hypothetical protein
MKVESYTRKQFFYKGDPTRELLAWSLLGPALAGPETEDKHVLQYCTHRLTCQF